jgi:hypothetical protein
MKYSLTLALCAFASLASADTIGTYGDTTVVTGPDSNPAWQLTSDTTNTYSGVYVTVTAPLTPDTLTELSADYVMLTGTFGGGAPRFSIIDTTNNANNEAYVYFGNPPAFTDPNNGNTSYANTGNYADLLSSDVRVYSNGFGGYGDGNTGQTWAQFLSDPGVGTTQIGYITIDLDAGSFTSTQVMDATDFQVNSAIYAPTASGVPEPAGLGLMACVLAALAGARLFHKRRTA